MKPAPIPVNDNERLAALYRYDILDTAAEAEFDDFTRLAAQICGVPMALISLVDKDRQWFKSRVGFEAQEGARDVSFCGHAILGRDVFEIPDATNDQRFVDNPAVTGDPNIRFYAGAPLLTKNGSAIGTLCVFDDQPKTLTDQQITALQALSRQVIRQMDLRLLVRREKELNQELVRQRNFQKLLFDSAMAGVASMTPSGLITSVNPAFERLVGYSAAELIQQKNIRLVHLDEELKAHASELSTQLDQAVAPGESMWWSAAMGIPEMRDWTYRRKDGSTVSVLVSTSPLHDSDNLLTGFVVMAWDITERKKVREEIERLNADLERRVLLRTTELARTTEDLQMLSYSLAHDLRQPLIAIGGFGHRLKEEVVSDQGQHYLERIAASIEQVNLRADALLYFANLSRRRLQRATVDLGQLATAQLSDLKRQHPQRQLLTLVQPELLTWADPELVTEAMHELILNAWNFTANRDQSLIEVGSEIGENGETIFFVRDNGAGFDMAYVNTLFEPFQRIETVPGSAGQGIGLAKVKRIVAKHGGKLWAESEIDQGAVFRFTLAGT
ncbi:ATP-binding protein [Polaromonas sp. YR568]|uniref:sensor histidine kinase n=1 Tax=Polaromonas sp. YR568 TaxID=1855301 RepID=UPI0031384396